MHKYAVWRAMITVNATISFDIFCDQEETFVQETNWYIMLTNTAYSWINKFAT